MLIILKGADKAMLNHYDQTNRQQQAYFALFSNMVIIAYSMR